MRTVYRYEVPVDDAAHDLAVSGPIIHVATRFTSAVEFWAEHGEGASGIRTFQVFGTGQPLPHNAAHIGSALTPGGKFVWHLFELLVGDAW